MCMLSFLRPSRSTLRVCNELIQPLPLTTHFPSSFLKDRSRPLLFSMARLDRVKNLTGLVEWYGKSPHLRQLAGLLVVGGHLREDDSQDREEREQIQRMHALIELYNLKGDIRWLPAQTDRERNGELYRCVADSGGAFVQVRCGTIWPFRFLLFGSTIKLEQSVTFSFFCDSLRAPPNLTACHVRGLWSDSGGGYDLRVAHHCHLSWRACRDHQGWQVWLPHRPTSWRCCSGGHRTVFSEVQG
jgi:hypothetical protein